MATPNVQDESNVTQEQKHRSIVLDAVDSLRIQTSQLSFLYAGIDNIENEEEAEGAAMIIGKIKEELKRLNKNLHGILDRT